MKKKHCLGWITPVTPGGLIQGFEEAKADALSHLLSTLYCACVTASQVVHSLQV
jgi:hypothetical protein